MAPQPRLPVTAPGVSAHMDSMRILAVSTTEADGTVTGVHPDDEAALAALKPGEETGRWTIVMQAREFFHLADGTLSSSSFTEAYAAAAVSGTQVMIRIPVDPLKRPASVPRRDRFYLDRTLIGSLTRRRRSAPKPKAQP